ncbi:hypothetical protein GQ44DRAFT_724591 [Phaeosphaeriaceae sp. PMI808]|nr:hypothetical protein GQ44DRAFT_724591 [Phaeosphaeriaceae sp. PMI808]
MAGRKPDYDSRVCETGRTDVIRGEEEEDSVIQVHTRRPKPDQTPVTPQVSSTKLNYTPSSVGGMDDINLSSPTMDGSPSKETPSIFKQDANSPAKPETDVLAIRGRTINSLATKGSVHDPIVLEEYSPRRKIAPLPSRPLHSQEPHKFQNRHRLLYKYNSSKAKLEPRLAVGSTFTGQKNHDMYRMMNAKAAVSIGASPTKSRNVTYGVPFETRFPLLAQHLAHQTTKDTQNRPTYAQRHSQMRMSLGGETESMLRKKAVQYIRESSRSQPHNMLSDDVDDTSTSESDPISTQNIVSKNTHDRASSSLIRMKKKKLLVFRDSSNHTTSLVTQTSLLTALLQVYPKSIDKKGLREDMAMLVSATNRRLGEWMKSETEASHKRRRSNADSTVSVGGEPVDLEGARKKVKLIGKAEFQARRDEVVRKFLSAEAGLWQDGSGEGVADVYGKKGGDSDGAMSQVESEST